MNKEIKEEMLFHGTLTGLIQWLEQKYLFHEDNSFIDLIGQLKPINEAVSGLYAVAISDGLITTEDSIKYTGIYIELFAEDEQEEYNGLVQLFNGGNQE